MVTEMADTGGRVSNIVLAERVVFQQITKAGLCHANPSHHQPTGHAEPVLVAAHSTGAHLHFAKLALFFKTYQLWVSYVLIDLISVLKSKQPGIHSLL